MPNKTEGVKTLVHAVLSARFTEPYGEDITLKVFLAIEDNAAWRRRYQQLRRELTADVVNKWGGRYVKYETGLNSIQLVSANGRSKLIKAYTKLGRGRRS